MNIKTYSTIWYVRFYKSFFESNALKEIESLPDSKFGPHFSSFVIHLYLKMIAYSTETNGNLVFDLSREQNDDLAYSICVRFGMTHMLDEVKRALMIMESYGLIEAARTENTNQLFVPYVPDNTGKVSMPSYQRAQRRIKAKNGEMLPEPKDMKLKAYGMLKNVYLTEEEYDDLKDRTGDIHRVIQAYSVSTSALNREKKKSDYDNLLRYAYSLEGDADG